MHRRLRVQVKCDREQWASSVDNVARRKQPGAVFSQNDTGGLFIYYDLCHFMRFLLISIIL